MEPPERADTVTSVAKAVRLTVMLAAIVGWLAATAITTSRVLTVGRGGHALMFDDVVYARVGQRLVDEAQSGSAISTLWSWISDSPHAPATESVAALAHLLPLPKPEALYVANAAVASGLLLLFASTLATSLAMRFGLAAVLVVSPFGYVLADEYRPDLWFTALAAILLVGNVPYRRGPDDSTCLPPVVNVTLALSLLYVKPSWLMFAIFVTGAVAIALIWSRHAAGDHNIQGLEPHAYAAIMLYVAGIAVWFVWLRQHFFDYVLSNALNAEYRLAPSRIEAVLQSLRHGRTYLGQVHDLMWPAAALAAVVLIIGGSLTSFRKRLLVSVIFSAMLPAVSLAGLLATWYSRHASPFQGMFSLGLIWAWLLLLCVIGVQFLLATAPPAARFWVRTTTAVSLAVPITLVASTFRTDVRHASELKSPTAPVQLISSTMAADCKVHGICLEGSSPMTFLVPLAEDVNSAGLEYYTTSEGAAGVAVSFRDYENRPDIVMEEARTVDYVVVRRSDYVANGIPINRLQDELLSLLSQDPEFRRLALPPGAGEYAVFAKTTGDVPR